MRHYCLIGRPLGHSFSARYFNERFARMGVMDACYTLEELASIEELPALLERIPDLKGFNVTIPYKQAVIPYLDSLSYEAQMIGAVNCVKCEEGRMVGYNTDVVGLRQAMAKFLDRLPDHALVLGTGGASQSVQFLLTELGIPFDLVSRDPMRGNYTYDNLPVEVFQESHLIVNATPVGTYPNVEEAPRLPYAFLTPSHYLFDLVYNPPVTSFLDYGRQRGAHIANGEGMLIAQAEANAEIWGL